MTEQKNTQAVGSFLFFPAAKALSFPFFLFAIFIMAGGVVFLQVAANPYVTALGPSETASGRLNLTQALNSIATYIAPIIASVFVFKTAADAALSAVDGLDKGELSMASGIINTLIVGGAVIPVLMGLVADGLGVRYAFILPIICYLYIVFFALIGSRHK
jgi:FHS family L-fucose permease-like MFS transporter